MNVRRFLLTIVVLALLFFTFIVGVGCGIMISGGDSIVGSGERVAVLKVEGIILDSTTYLDSISTIKDDSNIKALVLRVDSPGGAVAPAQEIFREVKNLEIPVIASMGTVAASGGYYIACAAQEIHVNPGTITGSIGVIAEFVNYKELLNWAKLDVEVVKSGEFKDVGSPIRELTEEEKQYIQSLIDDVHSQFKRAVSEARGMDQVKITRIADGRIFTGEQAKKLGLVDKIGTISDAIRRAGSLAGIEGEPKVEYYPKKQYSFLDFILSDFESRILPRFPSKGRFGLFYIADVVH